MKPAFSVRLAHVFSLYRKAVMATDRDELRLSLVVNMVLLPGGPRVWHWSCHGQMGNEVEVFVLQIRLMDCVAKNSHQLPSAGAHLFVMTLLGLLPKLTRRWSFLQRKSIILKAVLIWNNKVAGRYIWQHWLIFKTCYRLCRLCFITELSHLSSHSQVY